MIEQWADSNGRLSGAALVSANIAGALRYGGIGSSSKWITKAELADLQSHGRAVRLIAESSTTRADAGYSAGVADAQAMATFRASLGLPASTYIYATRDTSTWSQAVLDYVRGFRDVLGVECTGAYGFGTAQDGTYGTKPNLIGEIHRLGCASSLWQCGWPPSKTGNAGIVHFWQRQGTSGVAGEQPATPTAATLAGTAIDYNNRLMLEDDDMQPTDTVAFPNADGTTANIPVKDIWINADVYAGKAMNNTDAILTQLAAMQGSLTANQSALLAAIAAKPDGAPTDAQVLAQGNQIAELLLQDLPPEIIQAILTRLTAAAPAAPPAS